MKETFDFIEKQLEKNNKIVLLTVINWYGSSPGKTGFKLAVSSNGSFFGSIGGGAMEHRLVEKMKKKLNSSEELYPEIEFYNHDPDAKDNKSGMICSGNQTIAFIPLHKKDLHEVRLMLSIINNKEKGIWVINPNGMSIVPNKVLGKRKITKIKSEKIWEYAEQLGMPDTLFIFGGGHVGLALSKVFYNLNFRVVILDNRKDLNTMKANHFADEKIVIDYADSGKYVTNGFNIYVAVVTFAHKSDAQVLKQMINKDIKYLGMMGSAKKIETIYDNLIKEGISTSSLAKVFAPIGVPINSETPDEIAISIAAQIIKVKND